MRGVYEDYADFFSILFLSFCRRQYQKGRGIGDCGASSAYSYLPLNEKYILKEARLKVNCDGQVGEAWPVVYSH